MDLNKIKKLILEDKTDLFYKSKSFQDKRKEILIRDNYECQECKREGKVTLQQKTKLDIHHIKELRSNPELALDSDNLLTVCVYHHNLLDHRIKPKKDKFVNKERW